MKTRNKVLLSSFILFALCAVLAYFYVVGLEVVLIAGLLTMAVGFFVFDKDMGEIFKPKKEDNEKYSALHSARLKHTEGLPFASGVEVDMFYGRDKVVFKKDSQEVTLECNRIIDIDTVTGKDARSQAVGGALAGKVIGGGLGGAAVGALVATSLYLVISYKKDDETKYIILDTSKDAWFSMKIIKDFKANNHRETETIEL